MLTIPRRKLLAGAGLLGMFGAGRASAGFVSPDLSAEAMTPTQKILMAGSAKSSGLQPGPNQKILTRNNRIVLPARTFLNTVMASPPSVTNSTLASSMTGAFFRPFNSGNDSFPMQAYPADFASYAMGPGPGVTNVTVGKNPATYSSGLLRVSFMHDGSSFEFVNLATNNYFMIKVDDQYVSLTPIGSGASGTLWTYLNFGSSKRRRIDIIGQGMALSGININPTDTITAAPVRGPFAIAVGDSFTASGMTSSGPTWVLPFGDALGWDNVWNSGVGGTGYINDNGGTSPTFGQRLQHDVLQYNPEVVVFLGLINDGGASPAALQAAALSCFQQVVANGSLLFAAPNTNGGVNKYGANTLACKAAIKAACLSVGGFWLDVMELPLNLPITGLPILTATVGYAASVGASTIVLVGGALTTNPPQIGGTVQVGSGANLERLEVKSITFFGGSPYNWSITFDGTLQYNHSVGEPWTQVGGSFWTGHGHVGATTGFGNSDIYVSADGEHPTTQGYIALGQTLADLLMNALAPN